MKISSQKRNLIFLLLFLLFVSVCFAQRGGGSRSRSRSRGSSFGRTGQSYKNCTVFNGTTVCNNNNSGTITGGLSIFICTITCCFCCIINAEPGEPGRAKINFMFKKYQVKSQEYPSTLDEQQKFFLLDQFMRRKYSIVFNMKNNDKMFSCLVKIIDLKKQSQTKYKIKFSGSEQLGTSMFDGILIFRADGIGLKLSKVYDSRKKAGQVGRWYNLMYQGFGNPNQISGQWSYLGFQTNVQFSGFWSMQPM